MSVSDPAARMGANPATQLLHQRLRTRVLGIYSVTVIAAAILMVWLLWVHRSSSHELARDEFVRRTELRGRDVAARVANMARELQRLSLREEMDLTDADSRPEQRLLSLAHERSTYFPAGIAIVNAAGEVASAEPADFLQHVDVATAAWFVRTKSELTAQLVRSEPDTPLGTAVGITLPLLHDGTFVGAIVGAIELEQDPALQAGGPDDDVRVLLVASAGEVLTPTSPPSYVRSAAWQAIVSQPEIRATQTANLDAHAHIVAAAAVPGTRLRVISVATPDTLYGAANRRFSEMLVVSLLVLLVPGLILVWVMNRAVTQFTGAQLIAANDDRLRSLGEASSLIAHEIKNSLNGLQMGVDVVLQQAAPETRAKASTRALKDELQRLSSFTTRLLSFSRGVTVRAVPCDVAALVAGVVDAHVEAMQEAGIGLTCTTEAVHCNVDAALIHSIVLNLLSNSNDVLDGQTEPSPMIEVVVTKHGASALITVRDNGPGVAHDFVERMFQPFSTTKPSGVGIGLAVSKTIAVAHGGTLVYRAGEPRGAVFELQLPIVEAG